MHPSIAARAAQARPQRADAPIVDALDLAALTALAPRRCRDCDHPICPRSWNVPGAFRDEGRGLCRGCWRDRAAADTLDEVERTKRTRDDLMADWEILRGRGLTKRQAADRLGMTFSAFDRALQRARAAGDPRALPSLTLVVAGRHAS